MQCPCTVVTSAAVMNRTRGSPFRVAGALDERAGRCRSLPDTEALRRTRSPPLAGVSSTRREPFGGCRGSSEVGCARSASDAGCRLRTAASVSVAVARGRGVIS
jgi:hypothetical protein